MNVTRRSATEHFDTETLALLDAIDVPVSDFTVDLDVVFGTPLEMYEAGLLEHEKLAGLGPAAAADAIRAQNARRVAATDIAADDPTIVQRVRELLVDVLLPYAAQLRTAPPAAATPVSIAA